MLFFVVGFLCVLLNVLCLLIVCVRGIVVFIMFAAVLFVSMCDLFMF